MEKIKPPRKRPTSEEVGWAVVRLLLGLAQTGGAVASCILFVQTGMNDLSLTVALGTCLCTALSVCLFGGPFRRNP